MDKQVGSEHVRQGPGTTSNSLAASTAMPDTYGLTTDGILERGESSGHGMERANGQVLWAYLAAKLASVCGVLSDFNLLHLLPQRGTIAGTVLANDADLLGSLGLQTTLVPLRYAFPRKEASRMLLVP